MTAPLNFARTETVDHGQKITEAVAFREHLDKSLVQSSQAEEALRYKDRPKSLGAGRIGHPLAAAPWDRGCERALWFEMKMYPSDRPFPGKLYRIFGMGHSAEELVVKNLRAAGFVILTHDEAGRQFGFELARDPETGHARYKGFCDGVIIDGPKRIGGEKDGIDLKYPMLWENKALNSKKYDKFLSDGVERSHPHYYAQILQYQNFLDLFQNPALLTCLDRETGEIGIELVRFVQRHTQAILDRAARIIEAKEPLQLERAADEYTKLPCKWCDFASHCKKAEDARPQADARAQQAAPGWLQQSQS